MPFSSHLRLLISGVAVWAAFWLAGLPSYWQQYSFTFLAVGTAALVPLSAWIGWRFLERSKPEHRAELGLWLAVYFSLPFLLLDSLYCGLYLGHGTAFFRLSWYLTVFYVVPWVLFVPMGLWSARSVR